MLLAAAEHCFLSKYVSPYYASAHTLTTTFILLIRFLIEDSCLYANMEKKVFNR